ncbi:MAG: hypothetical protein REI96_06330 [Flavobacterium nitrogenifigens]|uniref:hypothetical protein n=1 Tax=Flavobacterium nitrogenifigens TaxID=1617283 RepID=UPI0028087B23|nr:hypothetical protein [Flavobacterium nitrogenifigens]MDQ8012044.1 hypothetical protein [Flavobacterium nitrogenifigens]
MILALTCKVVFHKNDHRKEDIVLNRVTEIDYESTWKEMTSRGSITLPRNVRYFNKYNVREVFRRGDPVTIYFGYDGNNHKEFIGYVSEVSADIPIVIKFEDEMFNVRKIPVNFSSKNISLKNLLETIIPGYEIDALEGVQLGAVRLSKTGVGPVLEKLQSDWGLYSYMRGKTVVCGKYYADESEYKPVKFDLERNCVSTSLNYKKKEDISLRIKVVSTLSNGKKVTVENIGDKDGNERQLTFYNIELKAELERLGKMEYEKYKVDRFEGSFTAFGIPAVRHGLKVDLKSTLYTDRNGKYYIEKVLKKFSPSGIRQEITLGEKVA